MNIEALLTCVEGVEPNKFIGFLAYRLAKDDVITKELWQEAAEKSVKLN